MNEEQIERFSRHILLPEVGGKGQERLLASKVLVVGAGGLGCPAALYLCAAGVGRLGLIDFDTVSLSNLQRQILYRTMDVGRPKTEVAAERLDAHWPQMEVCVMRDRVTVENARRIVRDYDVVIEGSDNFPTKFLVNDACVAEGKPAIIAGILRFTGQIMTVLPRKGPCYRCLFERPPAAGVAPTCAEAGVIGALAGFVGSIEAAEAIKLLLGIGAPLSGRLLSVDALRASIREIPLSRRPNCGSCGDNPSILLPSS